MGKLREQLKADKAANIGNKKGYYIVMSYRVTNHLYYTKNPVLKVIGLPVKKLYHWIFTWIMGIEIPERTKIGSSFQVWHGSALVINPEVTIGDNVLLRHSTTIGNKYFGSGVPQIGNNVEVGAQCIIIGPIQIGDNVTIGAGTIVTKSIPDDSLAYGNPMKIFPKQHSDTLVKENAAQSIKLNN